MTMIVEVDLMFCGKCGKSINSSFCPYCGAKNEAFNANNNINTNVNNNVVNNNVNNTVPVTQPKQKKQVNIILILIIIIVLLIIGIVSIFGYNLYKNNRTRTIMIYMVGADLESKVGLASNDLNYIDYKKTNANKVKVVLMAGGAKTWKNSYIDVSETSIYELKENGFVKVNQRDITNMGSQDNLSYFLNYVYDHYKTNKYDFLYWNHGGAIDGSEYDEVSNDHLELTEMAKSFENGPFKGSNKLELLGFRTCLNSTIEVANIYQNYAHYLVASEEVTMGSRLDSALRFVNELKPRDEGIDVGKKQINNYKETITAYCNYAGNESKEENYCEDGTYAIIDLSKIDKVNKELDKFSDDLNKNLSSKYTDMIKKRANLSQYASDDPSLDMIDLYNMTDSFSEFSGNSSNLKKSLENAVIYNWSVNDYSHGLSIYFPYNSQYFLKKYDGFKSSNNYNLFINNFYNYKKGGGTSSFMNVSENTVEVSNVSKESADVEVELTDEQAKNVSKASYYIVVDTKDGYYQIVFVGNDYELVGNKLKANVKGKLLRISDSEYEDLSVWVPAIEKQNNNKNNKYTDVEVLVTPNNPGFTDPVISAYLDVRIEDNKKEAKIKGFYQYERKDNQQGKFSAKSSTPIGLSLSDYMFIRVASSHYKVIDDNGLYNPNWVNTSNGIIEGMEYRTDRFKLIKEDFSSNYDYYAVFIIRDMANDVYYTKPVKIK